MKKLNWIDSRVIINKSVDQYRRKARKTDAEQTKDFSRINPDV